MAEHAAARAGGGGVGRLGAGVGTLIRLMLRRDRVKLPAWAGGIGALALYVTVAVPAAYGDELDAVTGLFGDPVGRMLTGPGIGLAEPTVERLISGGYGLYLMLAAAAMSILLVVRHTRGEEQSGRAELVRSSVVGRNSFLIAALGVAVLTNVVTGLVVLLVLTVVGGFAITGSVLLAFSVVAVGMAFAAVAAITVQLSEYTRGAGGMAFAALGAAFVLRAGGDAAEDGGGLLSWLSPLGWAQQTAPYALNRWWPLLLLAAFAVVCVAAGFALAARRDLGRGLRPVRPGRPRAHPSLGTPLGLAFRLQRANWLGWCIGLAVAGLAFGSFAETMLDATEDLPEVLREVFAGSDVLAGYLALLAMLMMLVVASYALLAITGVRGEESSGRGELVLATPVSRSAWFGSHLVVVVGGVVVMAVVTGASTGLGAALSTGDPAHVGAVVAAHLNLVPAVLIVLGSATLLFGLVPRALSLAWVLVGYGLIVGIFGDVLDLPDLASDLNPFEQVAEMPLVPFAAGPVVAQAAVAAVLIGLGVDAFRRREVDRP